MKALLLTLSMLLLIAPPARAAERTVLKLKFEPRVFPADPTTGGPPPVVSQDNAGDRCKLVSNLPDADSELLPVWEAIRPPLGRGAFSIVGTVAWRNVQTQARVEMDVEYPDGTHDHVGDDPQTWVQLVGTSAGKAFRLNYPGQPDARPQQVTLCVMIQGKGVITISDAKLVEPGPATTAPATAAPSKSAPLTYAPSKPASPEAAADAFLAARMDDLLANNLMAPARLAEARDEMAAGLQAFRDSPLANQSDAGERIRLKQQILDAYDRRIAAISGATPPTNGTAPTTIRSDHALAAATPRPASDAAVDAWLEQMRKDRRDMPNAGLNYLDKLDANESLKGGVIVLNDPNGLFGPTTAPAAGVPGGVPLRDLPPAVAAKVRQSMEDTLVRALTARDAMTDELKSKETFLGVNHREVGLARVRLKNLDQQIADLRQALAEPMTATVAPAQAAAGPLATGDGWRNLPLSERAYWSFSRFLVCHVGVVFGGALVWAFVRQGHFRRLATFYFAIVIIAGLAEIFGAGVAVGLRRPPEVAIVFLCGAIVMIGGPVLLLPQLNRVHADVELRKLRAMDVA